jgi:hypothetical protein
MEDDMLQELIKANRSYVLAGYNNNESQADIVTIVFLNIAEVWKLAIHPSFKPYLQKQIADTVATCFEILEAMPYATEDRQDRAVLANMGALASELSFFWTCKPTKRDIETFFKRKARLESEVE